MSTLPESELSRDGLLWPGFIRFILLPHCTSRHTVVSDRGDQAALPACVGGVGWVGGGLLL